MTELPEAATLLGVPLPGGSQVTHVDYLDWVARGLPLKALDRIAEVLAPGDVTFRYRVVSKASLARFKARRRLGPAQSVVVTRLASVWADALRVWKEPDAARGFLMRPHPLLSDRRPLDLALENELGADLVRGVLGRLENGSAV
jgi:putative toxin-antitoxin system antitoxin component (TIGR02293 family)